MRRNSLGDINQINVEEGDKYNIGTLNVGTRFYIILQLCCAFANRTNSVFKTRVSL